jgi:hypothetical protein
MEEDILWNFDVNTRKDTPWNFDFNKEKMLYEILMLT